jgi:hypothetical protein
MNRNLIFSLGLACCLLVGGAFAQKVEFEESWGNPGYTVLSQSAAGVEFVYSLPSIQFGTHLVKGQPFTTVGFPGVTLPNNAGAPDLPGTGRIFAFPLGAAYSVEIVASRTQVYEDITLLPASPIQDDNDDSPPVYERDMSIYGVDANYPASPVLVSGAKKMRGIDVFTLGVTPFTYNPVRKKLVVYTDLRVKVTFADGNGRFGDDAYRSRWFEPMLRQNLINYSSLPVVDFDVRQLPLRGGRTEECEYMIFVPDDIVFITWAKKIKDFRVKQGISTNIFNIADYGGTASGIEAKINDAYANWSTKPVAVLMLGDLPAMPVNSWNGSVLSDNIYADIDGDDLPELNIARITANDSAELELMIDKFIDYETSPPTNPSFYKEPIIAGGWQSDRWFIICCDVVWGFHDTILNKSPVREYAGYSGTPSYWSTNQNTQMIIDYFGPSGLGYIPATPSHLSDWGANATRINADINSGAFYMLHRDHGSPTGWGDPAYDISDLANLTNTDLCFVMSINCSTGAYDYNPESFAEAFHRLEDGINPVGALGVIAASATSYSFVNDTYVWGMHDSLWPQFDPGYGGSTGDNPLMPSFANTSGKWYLQASSWPYNPQHKVYTHHLFHMHGDAFLQLCDEIPQALTVSHAGTVDNTATSFDVSADAGSLIALSAHGEVLGTATATGGTTTVTIDPPNLPGIMYVTVTQPNHIRYEGQVVIQTGGPLAIWLPDGPPGNVYPGPETDVRVQIVDGVNQYVPGSGLVHYRFNPAETFVTASLTSLGGDIYNARIPGARPDSLPEFYVSADHSGGGTVYSPSDAPNTTYTYGLRGLLEIIVSDGFETGGFGPAWTTRTTGAGRILVTSANGPIGAYHVTMDSSTDGVEGTASMTLSVNLSGVTEADLSFYFKEFQDEVDPEDNLSISDGGLIWHKVIDLEGGTDYEKKTIDLAAAASQAGISFSSNFQIRWSWGDNYSIPTDGFAFDDIQIERVNMSPTIWAGAYAFSASAGCDIPLYLDAGPSFGGRFFRVAGGLSGSNPGTNLPGGGILPVNWDWLTDLMFQYPTAYPFQEFRGNLDSQGEAVARFRLPGPGAVPYVGMSLTFAFTLPTVYDFVSTPVAIEIEP